MSENIEKKEISRWIIIWESALNVLKKIFKSGDEKVNWQLAKHSGSNKWVKTEAAEDPEILWKAGIKTVQNPEVLKDLEEHSDQNGWGEPLIASDLDVLRLNNGTKIPYMNVYSKKNCKLRNELGEKALKEGNYDEAKKCFIMNVEGGNNEDSQYNLGMMYLKGLGLTENYKEAQKLFKPLAEKGNSSAQYSLGMCQLDSGNENYKEGEKWLIKAALQGHLKAQYSLGRRYKEGRNLEKNDKKAIKWFKKIVARKNESIREDLIGKWFPVRIPLDEYKEGIIEEVEKYLSEIEEKRKLDVKSNNKDKNIEQNSGIEM